MSMMRACGSKPPLRPSRYGTRVSTSPSREPIEPSRPSVAGSLPRRRRPKSKVSSTKKLSLPSPSMTSLGQRSRYLGSHVPFPQIGRLQYVAVRVDDVVFTGHTYTSLRKTCDLSLAKRRPPSIHRILARTGLRFRMWAIWRRAVQPQMSRATSTHRRIFAASSSTVTLLPGAVLAKPHCGLIES